jgi:hypothetical protein
MRAEKRRFTTETQRHRDRNKIFEKNWPVAKYVDPAEQADFEDI